MSPFLFEPSGAGAASITEYVAIAWLSSDLLITLPVVLYGARKRGIGVWWALANFPLLYVVRFWNLYYTAKAMIWELFLVPLGWKQSLSVWKKGTEGTGSVARP